nr:hypothetical protein GCM10020241_50410 [Streptoalloteichus tenebrarius]
MVAGARARAAVSGLLRPHSQALPGSDFYQGTDVACESLTTQKNRTLTHCSPLRREPERVGAAANGGIRGGIREIGASAGGEGEITCDVACGTGGERATLARRKIVANARRAGFVVRARGGPTPRTGRPGRS